MDEIEDFMAKIEDVALGLDLNGAPIELQVKQVFLKIYKELREIKTEELSEFGLELILSRAKDFLSDIKLFCDVYLKR